MAESGTDIVTPRERAGFLSKLLREQWLPGLAARAGASLARRTGKPFRVGSRVIAARHAHATEMLCRDLDFAIAPVNEVKINEVNGGPFVLGMDRSARLELERRALYASLAEVDFDSLRAAAEADIDATLAAVPAGGRIDAVEGYARPIAARTAQRLFGIKGPDERTFREAVRSVFAHTFLNLSNNSVVRDRAVRAGRLMGQWYSEEIARRRASGDLGNDMMGALLRQGIVDDDGTRRTLGGMLVGSIDTTASSVAKILKVASRDRDLMWRMQRDAGDLGRLDGWCNEALRRWPHNPIVMRSAVRDADLGGTKVKKGDSVIAWTQAAMMDASVFPDPKQLQPDRDPRIYLHLGGGLHPCSGRPVNRFQIPALVGALLARGVSRVGKMGWTGSFPGRLIVTLQEGPR